MKAAADGGLFNWLLMNGRGFVLVVVDRALIGNSGSTMMMTKLAPLCHVVVDGSELAIRINRRFRRLRTGMELQK